MRSRGSPIASLQAGKKHSRFISRSVRAQVLVQDSGELTPSYSPLIAAGTNQFLAIPCKSPCWQGNSTTLQTHGDEPSHSAQNEPKLPEQAAADGGSAAITWWSFASFLGARECSARILGSLAELSD